MGSYAEEHIDGMNHLIHTSLVMDVPVDDVSADETISLIDDFVRIGRNTGRTFQVTTVNVDFLVNSSRNPALLEVLQGADLSLADGVPIVWVSRLQRTPLRERVPGSDLVPAMADHARVNHWKILLFGSADGVAERAAALLRQQYPGADVIGMSGPMLRRIEDTTDELIEQVRSFDADIICVAFGNPKQEFWIDRFRTSLGIPVLIGVGGTLDFLVGNTNRAPKIVQRLGLEWVYRMMHEPRRLARRYWRDAVVFLPVVLRAVGRRLRPRATVDRTPAVDRSSDTAGPGATGLSSDGVVDCSAMDPTSDIDRSFIASTYRSARRTGSTVLFTNASEALRVGLRTCGVDMKRVDE